MAIKKQISKLFQKCGLKKFKLKSFCSSNKPKKSQNCENQNHNSIDQKLEINAQESKSNRISDSKRRSDEKPKPSFDTSLKPLNNNLEYQNHTNEKVSHEKYVNNKETREEEDMPGSVPIKLTVGEMQFTTRQQTLCAYPSYLSELFFIFRSPNADPNSSPYRNLHPQLPWPDKLFIDRDGSLFVYILEFLRTSTLPKLSLSTLQKLEREAKFYEIKPLQSLISKRIDLYLSFPEFKVIPVQNISSHEFSQTSNVYENHYKNYDGIYCTRTMSYEDSEETVTGTKYDDNNDNNDVWDDMSDSSSYVEVPIIYNPINEPNFHDNLNYNPQIISQNHDLYYNNTSNFNFNHCNYLNDNKKYISKTTFYDNFNYNYNHHHNFNHNNYHYLKSHTTSNNPILNFTNHLHNKSEIPVTLNSKDLFAPEYDLITVTTIPIFFKKCPFGHGEENRVNDFYCDTLCIEDHVVLVKEIVTCMVFKRRDT
ncbi:putative potassium channel tetramerization domain containing protein [Gigaspora margarita]|uniref:Putative potassium channel tetramerization domain containing protein n=1 Tax=Gigaspora margarita TaxID=4874 RepID=A0A8H4EMC1_GIGMA|nr:putative potassium channel tetramerization domain containing protein [Gigaspora margarita]